MNLVSALLPLAGGLACFVLLVYLVKYVIHRFAGGFK